MFLNYVFKNLPFKKYTSSTQVWDIDYKRNYKFIKTVCPVCYFNNIYIITDARGQNIIFNTEFYKITYCYFHKILSLIHVTTVLSSVLNTSNS